MLMEILTDSGFKRFAGFVKKKADCVEIEYMDGGEKKTLRGSADHRILCLSAGKLGNAEETWKRLDELPIGGVAALASGGETAGGVVTKAEKTGMETVWTPLGVDGERYLSGGIICHNCSFGGSTSTLVSEEGMNLMKAGDPVEYRLGYDWKLYEKPAPGGLYVMGVDSAMGNAGDYSAVQVLRVLGRGKYRQAAVYQRNTIRAEDFAGVVHDISTAYNGAMYIIENNDIGRTVADTLYYDIGDNGMISTDKRGNLGTRADRKTKIDACKTLKTMIETGQLEIVDAETINELSKFEEVSQGVFRATGDNHDDLVSALYWAAYCLTQPEIDLDAVCVSEQKQADLDALPPPMYMGTPGDSVFGAGIDANSFWRGLN